MRMNIFPMQAIYQTDFSSEMQNEDIYETNASPV